MPAFPFPDKPLAERQSAIRDVAVAVGKVDDRFRQHRAHVHPDHRFRQRVLKIIHVEHRRHAAQHHFRRCIAGRSLRQLTRHRRVFQRKQKPPQPVRAIVAQRTERDHPQMTMRVHHPRQKQASLPVDHFVHIHAEIIQRQNGIVFPDQAAVFKNTIGFIRCDQRHILDPDSHACSSLISGMNSSVLPINNPLSVSLTSGDTGKDSVANDITAL